MEQQTDMDLLAVNTIRILAIDAIQKAKSGHPGTPMDAVPTAYALWQRPNDLDQLLRAYAASGATTDRH